MRYYVNENRLYTFSAIARFDIAIYRDENHCYRIEGSGSRQSETNLQPTLEELTACILEYSSGTASALSEISKTNWQELNDHFRSLLEIELEEKREAAAKEKERIAREAEAREILQKDPLYQWQHMVKSITQSHVFWFKNSAKNYWDWRKVMSDKVAENPDHDPDDVSVRNLHYGALSAIKCIEDFEHAVEKFNEFVQQRKIEAGHRRDQSAKRSD